MMNAAIITALITGGCSVIAVVLTNLSNQSQTDAKLDKHQAVLEERISTLTERVDKHNNLVERTYSLEAKVEVLEKLNKQ